MSTIILCLLSYACIGLVVGIGLAIYTAITSIHPIKALFEVFPSLLILAICWPLTLAFIIIEIMNKNSNK